MDINLVLKELEKENNNYRLSTNANDGSATIVFWDSSNSDSQPTPQDLQDKWDEIKDNYDANIDPVFSAVDSTKMPLSGGTFTGSVTFEDAINENVYAITDPTDGSDVDLDPDNGMIQTWTLGGNRTATDSLSDGQSLFLRVGTSGSNEYSVTFPTNTKFLGGFSPAISKDDETLLEIFKVNSTLYVAKVGDFKTP